MELALSSKKITTPQCNYDFLWQLEFQHYCILLLEASIFGKYYLKGNTVSNLPCQPETQKPRKQQLEGMYFLIQGPEHLADDTL